MHSAWLVAVTVGFAVVACRAPNAPQTRPAPGPRPPAQEPTSNDDAPLEELERVAALTSVPAVQPTAAPARASIIQLAVSSDGLAALTADARGELRLWPALDGSREPMVVDPPGSSTVALANRRDSKPPPTAIALARHQDAFTAFFITRDHELVIAQLGADGVTRARAVAASPKVEAFAMAEPGLVVLRRDHTVAVFAPDGQHARRIAAMPGERINAITAAGAHAAVVVEREGRIGIRVLKLAPRLAWGPYAEYEPDHARFAISPRGDRLAVVTVTRDWKPHLIVTELHGGLLFDDIQLRADAIGFVDENTLVYWADSALNWLDVRDRKPRKITLHARLAKPLLVIAGNRAFSRSLRDIAIAGPTSTEFLGYTLASPKAVDQLASGELLVASTTHLFTTDLQLGLRKELGQDHHTVNDLRWLAGDDVAAVVDESSGSRGDSKLYLMNVARGTWTQLRSELSARPTLAVEPSTGMLAVNDRESELLRYRAAISTVVSVAKSPRRSGDHEHEDVIQPLDPKLAGGARVAHVHHPTADATKRSTVSWFAGDTLRGAPMSKQQVDGDISALDAAGKVYAWIGPDDGPGEVAIVAPGKRASRIRAPSDGRIWPDRRGERFAMTNQELAMFRLDGTRLWSREIGFVERALWLSDGTLAVFDESGIARLDPANGQVLARRCGWQFGLASVPHEPWIDFDPIQNDDFDPYSSKVPSLCTRTRP
jgi:hypothetical protein